jgi:hypothetical protein
LSSGKEYIYSLQDLSLYSHTADFIAEKILEIIEKVGSDKISSIVSDNVATMVSAKRIVNAKYNHIISVRCIAHHVNLLTTDIMRHEHSKNTIMNCMKIVKYFRKSYRAGAYLSEILKNTLIEGGGLKGYTKTRWTTAFDCLASIKRCESSLYDVRKKNILFFYYM